MRRFLACVVGLLLGAASAVAQEIRFQGVDVFGGYSYVSVDTNGLTSSRQSANGWEASLSVNLHKYFAAEVDGSGYYKNYNVLGTAVDVSDYGFAAGPRFNYRGLFFHSLFGLDHLTGSAGISDSQNGFALIEGGGVQVPVARRWAVRGSVDWVLTHHNIFGGPQFDQNNVRVSAGLVYTWRPRDHGAAAVGGDVGVARDVRIPGLGVTVQNADQLRIVAVDADGSAARSGLKDGDVLLSIDGRTVHTAQEVNAALAANTNRTVKIGYLLQGTWTVEVNVALGGSR